MAQAQPGEVICVQGDHSDERVIVQTSGTPDALITVEAVGNATTGGFIVEADNVIVRGFEVRTGPGPRAARDGAGIFLEGHNVLVEGNVVRDPAGNGITCSTKGSQCRGVTIRYNRIEGADGQGIEIIGADDVVEHNRITGSIARFADDADGMRFFGTGHRIRDNTITDIAATLPPGSVNSEVPHADCFQTYDIDGRGVADVIIERNVCTEVADQCLIATAGFANVPPDPPRSTGIVFRSNVCDTAGSQAVLLVGVHDTVIAHNAFLDELRFYGVHVKGAATGISVLNNVFIGSAWPYYAEDEVPAPIAADGNIAQNPRSNAVPAWQEPSSRWGVDAGLVITGRGSDLQVRPTATSVLVDASVDIGELSGPLDVRSAPRRVDGNGDGIVTADVGPTELQPAS